jgi:hypothetical protein
MPPRRDAAYFDRLSALFATLQPEEVEQFYAAYRQWLLQHRIVELRQRLAATQEEIVENERRMQQVRPSPLALASLARLQANGVSDVDLLDQMLERGEEWLDATMQRLDYCEQFENFLADDYTQWARLALEGAFDWIDSALTPNPAGTQDQEPEPVPSPEDVGEVEAQFLQRLATEDENEDENDLSWQEPTLKQAAVIIPRDEPVIDETADDQSAGNELIIDEPAGEEIVPEAPEEHEPVEPEQQPDIEPPAPGPEPERELPANKEPEIPEPPAMSEPQGEQQAAPEQAESKPLPPPIPRKQSLSRRLIGKLLGE